MMGMNGVGSAGMTPEMVAYYQQQQQLLASNNGGTAGIPRFAPTQFGQVPPEFKPEDTNSAFWTPTLVGAGVGTIGAGIGGTLAYNDARYQHVNKYAKSLIGTENTNRTAGVASELTKTLKAQKEQGKLGYQAAKTMAEQAVQNYDTNNTDTVSALTNEQILADPQNTQSIQQAKEQALRDYLKNGIKDKKEQARVKQLLSTGDKTPQEIFENHINKAGKQKNKIEQELQKRYTKSEQGIIDEIKRKDIETIQKSKRQEVVKEAVAKYKKDVTAQVKTTRAEIAAKPEYAQLALETDAGKAHVYNQGVTDASKIITESDVQAKNPKFKTAEAAFSKSVLESAEHNPNGKKLGLSKAGGRAATVFAIATTVGAGIGVWQASKVSSRNEDKANQLALLRQQEAAANAGGTPPLVGGGGFAPA